MPELTREQMERITITKRRCPICRKLIVVTDKGTLARHNVAFGMDRGDGIRTIYKCEGGGLPVTEDTHG